jgi:hypothetical protein
MAAPYPEFPVRDFKLDAITKLAHNDWSWPEPKTAALQPVVSSLRANTSRIRLMMLLPTSIAGMMASAQRLHCVAELELTGTLGRDDISPDLAASSERRWRAPRAS